MPEDDGVTCRLVDLYGLYAELLEVSRQYSAQRCMLGLCSLSLALTDGMRMSSKRFRGSEPVLADIVLDLAHNRYGSKG